ncbi:isoamyl alcohol oxidase [Colletotrichum truncatum]|uniref:Isoamyl alcohol oxidase n=1 Tax=Colletotrichum truncatum TaxID=5467 RepID=A0ACC3YVJ2_COLTU|nr:isoamyl alcohol oxidase [Colletotrichum truncatum]KAF6781590.1 isoamyl alcohol oxidase [Colletotrichum truncatum]
MSYLILAACAAVAVGALFLVKQLVWHPLAAYPGPLLGRCTNLYAAYHAWRGTLHYDMYRCHQKYGPVVRYSPSRLLINSNNAAREISAHGANVIKSKAYQALVHSAPNTLTIRNRDDHARRRRILSLAFSDAQLRAYESILLRHIENLCLNLSENSKSQATESGAKALDMSHQCDYFTFDVMSEVIFGMKYNALRETKYRYVMQALEESNVRISALVQASSLALGRIDKYLFSNSIKSRNRFLGFLGSLLKNRSKASFTDNGNVFSYLETAKDPNGESTLSKSEIRAESATLVVAGSDTSSTTLAATLFYLSGNSEAYSKLCHEIRSTFQSEDEIRIGAKLSACNYLKACIDETLRMSPPVGGALWREIRPGGMKIGSLFLPEGIDVGTGIYSLHHHADYFDSPFEYKPERWVVGEGSSTKESVELARSAFYPFSSGPRSCVGKGFAYHEITLTLAHILYKFDFSRSPKDQLSTGGSTGNVNEFQMWDHVTSAKTPGDRCWPSDKEWGRFNSSIYGRLIQTTPPAAPCYAGPLRDAAACEAATKGWISSTFYASQPIGYDYPLNGSCPLAQFAANAPSTSCTIGNSPVFAVNVTDEEHISKAVEFAKEHNIRLVIKSTGHDFLQRSTGYGSLSIWLQNYRRGFNFHDDYQVVNDCPKSDWKGSALTITGAYAWSDIYPAAFEKNLIVVGGNNRGPCSTGGWTQGGGHSPVTRYYGLGADQVLSARVVLASGEIVTASPCVNSDLFYAIRGGGGGTYGVVTQMTVKTYPTKNIDVIDVFVGTSSMNTTISTQFLDTMTEVYSSFPYLSEVGFAGYGSWAMNSPVPIGGNFSTIYTQSFTTLGNDAAETTRLFKPLAERIMPLANAGFTVSITQKAFTNYGSYYANKSGTDAAVGTITALASRLLGKSALEGNRSQLRLAMETMAGANGKAVFHTIVHHGLQTAVETRDKSTAVQPGWYDAVILDIFERPVLDGSLTVSANTELFDDIRRNVLPVYRKLSPNTGTYMNEADWGEEDFQEDFYSSNWKRLIEIKTKYDPSGIFYCQTCVGSDEWAQQENGALCRRCPSRETRCNGRNDGAEGMCACW